MSDKPLLAVDLLALRWGDMDALGHLNNTLYFRFFEQARVEWLEHHGWRVSPDAGQGPVLASTACQFRQPLHYPATVRVETWVERLGNSSFTLGHRLCPADQPEQIAAEGEAVLVWVDYASGASQPLPERLRAQLREVVR
ncbi:acyl-CoA thioesterase [Chitinimonas lacunae]|uniref:Acyl-CoA thioesterase n=1 Tax=Chitinimonas lacunae TaxID=1963018 RepID=A0ABV8MNS0_9NEIS